MAATGSKGLDTVRLLAQAVEQLEAAQKQARSHCAVCGAVQSLNVETARSAVVYRAAQVAREYRDAGEGRAD